MANNNGIRKTIQILIEKVKTLENESFMQKLLIDELENKLQVCERTMDQLKADPFANFPKVAPPPQLGLPISHTCIPGYLNVGGATYCKICGTSMIIATIGSNTTNIQNQNSTCQELDFDITWVG
jgi:hypothetical protein